LRLHVSVRERKRHIERERERDRQTDRQRQKVVLQNRVVSFVKYSCFLLGYLGVLASVSWSEMMMRLGEG